MAQPFDYSLNLPSGFQSFGQGYQFGASLAQAEAQRMAAQQAAEAQLQRQQVLNAFLDNPNPTAQDFLRTAAILPKDQAEVLRQGFEAVGKERQQNDLRFAGQAMASIQAGRPEMAEALLRERAQAETNAGNADTAKQYEVFAELAKTAPDAALKSIGIVVAQLPGGDKVLEGFSQLGDEQRAAALAPLKLTQEQVAAKYAEANAAAEAARLAKGLELTTAQIAEVRARTKALAEGQTLEAKGVIPADKRPEAESKLRKEYNDNTKVFQEVASAYNRLQASEPTAAGDLALIFQFMKMLDPGSVVREGEFANAQNAAGIPTRIQNIYNKLLSGERLSADQRGQFTSQAGKLYEAEKRKADAVRSGITRIGQGMGLNTENLFYDQPAAAPGQPQRSVEVDY